MYKKLSEDELNVLWNEYYQNKSEENRNRIIMAYSYLVSTIGSRLKGICVGATDLEDIISQGFLALIEAIERFQPDRDVKFETFASIRIRGAMIDYIRKQDLIPRRVRKLSKDIDGIRAQYRAEKGREPTDEEIAEIIGVTVDKLNKYKAEIYNATVVYFDAYVNGQNGTADSIWDMDLLEDTPEQDYVKKELENTLAEAIDTLSYQERTLISLYYHEELKLKEIAYVFDVTESRACQIHIKALEKIKKYLKSKGQLGG